MWYKHFSHISLVQEPTSSDLFRFQSNDKLLHKICWSSIHHKIWFFFLTNSHDTARVNVHIMEVKRRWCHSHNVGVASLGSLTPSTAMKIPLFRQVIDLQVWGSFVMDGKSI